MTTTTAGRPAGSLRGSLRRRLPRGDQGYTLLAAIATASVCLMLATTLVAAAVRSDAVAGGDRNRSQAAAASEGGIDRAVAMLDGFNPSAWNTAASCQRTLTPTGGAQVVVTFVFSSGGTTDPCPLSAGSSYTAVTATSTATQTTGSITRTHTMRADVVLRGSSPFTSARFQGSTAPGAMPRLTYSATDWAPATVTTWPGSCTTAILDTTLPAGSDKAVVLDARSCDFSWSIATLRLDGDVTIIARSFSASIFDVVSADGAPHTFRLIVPAAAGSGDVCSPAKGGAITISDLEVSPKISSFFYTPGPMTVSIASALTGSVYTCTLATSIAGPVTYSTTPLPPVPSGGPFTVAGITKTDVLG